MNGDNKLPDLSCEWAYEMPGVEVEIARFPTPERCLLAYWLNLWKKKHREMCGGKFSGTEMFFTE
jgi:hypothetical protein